MNDLGSDYRFLQNRHSDQEVDMSIQMHRKRRIEGTTLVIFGASGDLTSRKILPAIASLWDQSQLPEEFSVIGVARSPLGNEGFRKLVMESASGLESISSNIENFHYLQGDYSSISTYQTLAKLLDSIEQTRQTGRSRLFYLATIPSLFGPALWRESAQTG